MLPQQVLHYRCRPRPRPPSTPLPLPLPHPHPPSPSLPLPLLPPPPLHLHQYHRRQMCSGNGLLKVLQKLTCKLLRMRNRYSLMQSLNYVDDNLIVIDIN